MRSTISVFFLTAISLCFLGTTIAAPGQLDPTFGVGGKVLTPFEEYGVGVKVQPGGSAIAQGFSWIDSTYFLFRISSNGTPDSSFGTNGFITRPYIGDFEVLPNGMVLVAGAGNTWMTIYRFDENGLPDLTFGQNGAVTLQPDIGIPYLRSYATKIAVDLNGKMTVLGQMGDSSRSYGVAIRLNSDGTYDGSFGTGGVKFLDQTQNRLVLQVDEKVLLLAGSIIKRLNSDGSLDTSFGEGGSVDIGLFSDDLAVRPDGSILVTCNDDYSFFGVKQYKPDGTADPSFGDNGSVYASQAYQIAIQKDGKVILSNGIFGGTFSLARLNKNGSYDSAFGANGIATASFGGDYAGASAIDIQNDGKILVTGWREERIVFARFEGRSNHTRFDFDGDGKADPSVFRPGSEGVWYVLGSGAGYFGAAWGNSADRLVAADYDGDGRTDIAINRDGVWYVLGSGGSVTSTQWGNGTDIPVPADYDGDGKADLAIVRDGVWWILNSNGSGYTTTQWGNGTDVPVPADYDGDGKADLAVVRDGVWYILNSGGGHSGLQWGNGSDKLVPADYDGDGKTDAAIVRDGTWWILNSNGGTVTSVQWGNGTDTPVPADYDGDGKADPAIVRDGTWWVLQSTGGYTTTQWGSGTDIPIPLRTNN